jgi:two-component system nitrogen regulation sensor histidine kinase NtrY
VLTFDDITQQLLDQRRAAWSDVARRIAHEIKNPLTPIQLAAERLQRRYGRKIDDGGDVYAADRHDRAPGRRSAPHGRRILLLRAHAEAGLPPGIADSTSPASRCSCTRSRIPTIRFDSTGRRRCHADGLRPPTDRPGADQLVKNAVEAIEKAEGRRRGAMRAVILSIAHERAPGVIAITIADNGIGLPAGARPLVEPYVTTRSRGTGLGLAIVKKIVEEHFGTMRFLRSGRRHDVIV